MNKNEEGKYDTTLTRMFAPLREALISEVTKEIALKGRILELKEIASRIQDILAREYGLFFDNPVDLETDFHYNAVCQLSATIEGGTILHMELIDAGLWIYIRDIESGHTLSEVTIKDPDDMEDGLIDDSFQQFCNDLFIIAKDAMIRHAIDKEQHRVV